MEGVIVLSNNKALLTTRFSNPRLADLSIDAFLNARRNQSSKNSDSGSNGIAYSYDNYDGTSGSSSSNGKSRDQSIDPIVWFEAFEDLSSKHASSSQNGGSGKDKGKARGRLNSYTMSDDEDEDEETDSEEDESEDDDEDKEDVDASNAWASTSTSKAEDSVNGASKKALSKTSISFGCCHISHNNLHFLVPMRRDSDPSIAFSYLYSLIGVLRQYIGGEVNDASMKENFDVTLQLLEETFSAPYPVSTDASALQELVPSSSLFSKMLMAGLAAATQATSSVSGLSSSGNNHMGIGSSSGNMTPSSLFSSPLYWRRSGIKYAQNEIFFDVNEEIKAVVDKNGQVINGDVWGRIDCRCRLSGMPDVSLSLSNAGAVDDPSFHPCVRIGKWTAGKSLSFVPPDGEFELMGYRLSTSSPGSLYRHSNASGRSSDTLPLRIRPVITTGEVGGSFNISLAPSGTVGPGGVAILEDVIVELYLGSSATAVKASIQSNDSRRLAAISSSGSSSSSSQANKIPPGGSWTFDSITRILTWKIPKLVSSPVLSGTWQYDDNVGKSDPSPVMSVRFKAPLTNVSGLSITSLKVLGEKYSMYKGLRSNMKGHVEVRW